MKVSQAGLDLIKGFEGLRLKAYRCPAGIWTIGYGSTNGVREGMLITEAEANDRLERDAGTAAFSVNHYVRPELKQCQFDALVSFAFNLGGNALSRSTLLKKVNAEDWEGAANEFMRWVYADGVIMEGLRRRRLAEKKMFQGLA